MCSSSDLHERQKENSTSSSYSCAITSVPKSATKRAKLKAYYYSDDWTDLRNYKPKRIPAFGCSKEDIEIYFIKPYSVGMKYYSLPDYIGGVPYAVLEEDISEYLINETQNSFFWTCVD